MYDTIGKLTCHIVELAIISDFLSWFVVVNVSVQRIVLEVYDLRPADRHQGRNVGLKSGGTNWWEDNVASLAT